MTAKFTKGDWKICPIEKDREYIRIRGTRIGGLYKIANVIDLKTIMMGLLGALSTENRQWRMHTLLKQLLSYIIS